MGQACCIEKKGDDLHLDSRKSNTQRNLVPGGVGVSGPHNNPFKHRAGEGYEEMRAKKEA